MFALCSNAVMKEQKTRKEADFIKRRSLGQGHKTVHRDTTPDWDWTVRASALAWMDIHVDILSFPWMYTSIII